MQQRIEVKWVSCPLCGGNTRTKVRADTVLFHQPIFCPRCKKEFLVNVKNFKTEILNEPDAMTQS